jgi:hypothetical protein
MFRSRESFSHRVPSPLGSLIAEGRGGSEATGEGRLSRGASLERFAHFEILSLTHTHPPCAQNDGATSALCALRSAL